MKWLYLTLFALVALASQMLWLNFGPLITYLMETYKIDEDTANLPLLVFPVFYVLLSINAGALIDKKGYKKIMTFGCILMTIGAAVRIMTDNFWVVFAGQCIIAISQPYIINGVSKLVANWFAEKDAGMAVGIGTAGMFLGMAVGVGFTADLVIDMGFQTTMIIMAAITALFSLLFIALVKENKAVQASGTSVGGLREFGQLLKNKNIIVLNILSFLSLGFFNGLFGWLDPILKEQGLSPEKGGDVGAALIFSGIIGAAIIPIISDKVKRRKIFMILAAITATLISYPLMTRGDYGLLIILAVGMGFVFLPGYAILLTCGEEEAGKEKAGASTGLIMLSGNLGGIVVMMGMEAIKGDGSWKPAVYFCVAILVLAVIFAFMMKETFKKTAA